jgi:hypothetical protein
MIDPIEDLVGEAEIAVRDAYQRGMNSAMNSMNKIPQTRKMLFDFLKFIQSFKLSVYEGEQVYMNEDALFHKEELISLFLLKYDYEQD